jgi:Carboxypeptidase regulatory-like domain
MLIVAGAVGCDPYTGASGVVLDSSRTPISGALAELTASRTTRKIQTVTNAKGRFGLSTTHGPFPGTFMLTVSKRGYATQHQTLRTNTLNRDLQIILRPE